MEPERPTIIGYSAARPGSLAGKDAFAYATRGGSSVLVLADGVSASARGGEAATVVCVAVTAAFEAMPLAHLLQLLDWVRAANRRLFDRYGGAGLCTIVAVAIEPGNSRLTATVVHAGDSLCAVGAAWIARVVTHEHRGGVPRRQIGQLVLRDGSPIIDIGLTKCLGAVPEISPDIVVLDLPQDALVVLFTDGVPQTRVQEFADIALSSAARRLRDTENSRKRRNERCSIQSVRRNSRSMLDWIAFSRRFSTRRIRICSWRSSGKSRGWILGGRCWSSCWIRPISAVMQDPDYQ